MQILQAKEPLSFAYSATDVTNFFNNITAKGGTLFIVGPLAINSTGAPLDSTPARAHVIGIGEVDWTTSSSGTTGFIWGADSITENIYFHEASNYYHTIFHTDQFATFRYWTNFPSQGGTATGTPLYDIDANINLEFVGYIANSIGFSGRSKAGVPTTTDLPTNLFQLWKNTTSNLASLFYNDGGTVRQLSTPDMGTDNRSVTSNDGSPVVLFATPTGASQMYRISGHAYCTAYTSGTIQYTIGWTENAQAKTATLTATLTAANTFSDIKSQVIKPDASTNITTQVTGITTATVSVGAVAERFS
jgi:hypothetical protein